MFHRLQMRLLVTFIGVVVLALIGFVLVTAHGTHTQFEAYLARDAIINLNRASEPLKEAAINQDFETLQNLAMDVAKMHEVEVTIYDAEGTIMAASAPEQVNQKMIDAPLPETGLVLHLFATDEQVTLVHFLSEEGDADSTALYLLGHEDMSLSISSSVFPGQKLSSIGDGLPFFAGDVAQPLMLPPDMRAASITEQTNIRTAASQQAFLQSVNRSLLLAATGTILIAAVLSWATSNRILGPVKELITATRQMEQGNLQVRVSASGQDELAELSASFNKMATELSRQEQLRRNLVTDVAHELLTPLTTIRGNLEALQDGLLRPTAEVINSLHNEVMLLDHLIADLQDLSLAEAGQLQLNLQPVALADVVEEAVTAAQPQARENEITITADLPYDLPLVNIDARRMGQVLRNLLANAIKHTPPGGHVAIRATHDIHNVEVAVQDNGAGIAQEHLPHIFDRFYRADKSRSRDTGGSGLGLTIVQSLVEAHHGRIRVESTPGAGSTFTFTLPIDETFRQTEPLPAA